MMTLKAFQYFLLVALLLECASSKTRQKQYVESVPLVKDGQYGKATEIIEESKEDQYKEKDRVLYYLDMGMVLHWAGEYEESNIHLTQAEQAIEELFTKSVSKGLTSAVLNDNALDYSGEDYEDIYLNVFKCLNYIALRDIDAAHVEIRRVQIKLNLLEDKYKELIEEYNSSGDAEGQLEARENKFHNDVLARYLSALLYRAEGALDDARIDIEAINEAWLTQAHLYDFEQPPMPMLEEPKDGKALVNILSFSGLGPVKLASTLYADGAAGFMSVRVEDQDDAYADEVLGFSSVPVGGAIGGIHVKMQFPRLESRLSKADRIMVKFNGAPMAELPLLEDMDGIARETFLLKLPLTVGRTIIRAAIKNITKEVGKAAVGNELSKQGLGGALLGLVIGAAADVAVDATENADLRISQFFPAYARAAEIAVEPGIYEVSVEYWDKGTLLGTTHHGQRNFIPGQLNLIESYILK